MKIRKRIMSFVLVLVLVVGILPWSNASAADSFSVTGLHANTNIRTSDQAWLIYLNYEGTYTEVAGETFSWTASLNGESTMVSLTQDAGMPLLVIWSDQIATDGTANVTLALKAGSVTGDQGTTVTLAEDATFCFNRYGLSMNTPIVPDTTKVTLKKIDVGAASHIYMRASKNDAFPDASDWSIKPIAANGYVNGTYYFTNRNGITIGDTFYAPSGSGIPEFIKQPDSGNAQLDYFINPGEGYAENTQLALQGLFLYDGKLVEYTTTTFTWDGTTWTQLVEKDGSVAITGMDTPTAVRTESEDWLIYTKYSGSLGETVVNGTAFRWPATLNGVETEVTVIREGEWLLLNLPKTQVAIDGSAEATLALRSCYCESNDGTVLVELTETMVFYFNEYGVSMTAPIIPDVTGIEFSLVDTYTNTTQITMRASKEDDLGAAADDWSSKPKAQNGYRAETGNYYFTNQNGIVIGDTFYAPNTDTTTLPEFLKRPDSGNATLDYFINVGAEQDEGTKLTVGGLFWWNDQLVEYTPTTFEWDGENWYKWTKATMLTDMTEQTGVYETVTFTEVNTSYTQYSETADGWLLYLEPDESLPGVANDRTNFSGLQMSIDDGDKFDVSLVHSSGGDTGFIHVLSQYLPQTVTTETKVVLHAGSAVANDGNHGIHLVEDFTMTVHEDGTWTTEERQSIQFTGLDSATGYNETAGGWDIYLQPSEVLNGTADETTYSGLQLQIKTDDVIAIHEIPIIKASHADSAFIRLWTDVLPSEITEETELRILAGNAESDDGYQFILTKDVILTVNTDREWSVTEYDGTDWQIHLEADAKIPGEEGEVFLWPIILNEKKETALLSVESGRAVLRLPSSQVATDGSAVTMLTLKQGKVTGDQGSVLKLAEDKVLSFNAYGLSIDKPIAPDTEKVGMATILGATSNPKVQIYLDAIKEDAFPESDWSTKPTALNGFVNGAYYYNGNGVFIGETMLATNASPNEVEFIKHNTWAQYQDYFINLSSVESQIVNGTTVTLKGLFTWTNEETGISSIVEYIPTEFVWNETTGSWEVSVETTYIAGDVNGDGSADAGDIVRMKRYLANTDVYQVTINATDADLIKEDVESNVVNATDLKELRRNMVDAEQIELAAYCGPRRAGYRLYCDNDNDDGSDGTYDGNNNVATVYGTHPEDPEEGWEGWITEDGFRDYLNCGFTYLLPEQDGFYDYSYTHGNSPSSVDSFAESDLYDYLELAEKMNIPVVVTSNKLIHNITGVAKTELTEQDKNYLREMYQNLEKYRMLKGYSFKDEPDVTLASSFLVTKNYLNSLNPNLYYSTAYLPITSKIASLTTQENVIDKEIAYGNYMDALYVSTGTFTYDLYPLWHDKSTDNNYIDDAWFQNLRLVAKHAKENNYDAGITVQSTSYGTARTWELKEHPKYHRTIETKADVGFQVYTALAYGMKSINYYTYWTHWSESARSIDTSAMVNYPTNSGEEPIKTKAYYAVSDINWEIKKFDHVFLDFNWEGTMALLPENVTATSVFSEAINEYASSRIDKASVSEETIVGCMKDSNGRDGFMFANATEPSADKSSTVSVKFKDATKVLAYIEGEETEITLQDGVYEFKLGAGEGVFIIPLS